MKIQRSVNNHRNSQEGGFSLVEVTLALGICASGLLLMIGMLPAVLNQVGDAADRNAYARIKQSMSARYAMMDWNILEEKARAGDVEVFHFDFAGTQVAQDEFDAIYAAEIRIGNRRTLPGDTTHNRFIRNLEIRVTQALQKEDAFSDPKYHDLLTASLGNEARLSEDYRD